ncbi:MAG: putative Ig domain-containing protein, partial [Verrucomicrobiia bacterium]
TVIRGGTGYSSTNTTVTFSGGGATTQATGTAVVDHVVSAITVTNGGSGYLAAPTVTISGGGGSGATAEAIVSGGAVTSIAVINGGSGYTNAPTITLAGFSATTAGATGTITGTITAINVTNAGSGYTSAPTVTITSTTGGTNALVLASPYTEVKLVPAEPNPAYPPTWPTDGRDGGVPDPAAAGPMMLQIGNEGGFLPLPVYLPNQPVSYEYSRRVIFVLNVKDKTLELGPAMRADVIIDFSSVPSGSKLILYNDGPCPWPGFDPRLDYYSGDPDQSASGNMSGGAPTTLPGYGPNTRTIMRFEVSGTPTAPFNTSKLAAAWPAVYRTAQDPPIVPQSAYGPAYGTTFPDQYLHVSDPNLIFTPFGGTNTVSLGTQDKAIIENWDFMYGRMNALLGGALPNLGPQAGTATPLSYFNPPTELIYPSNLATPVGSLNDGTQIWRLDHQGVDEHSMHWHLFNVQVINRIALDGTLFPPDANEVGWKETVRLPPAVDTIIAIRPYLPTLPWSIPNSVRPLDPSSPIGASMMDASGTMIANAMQDYGWEYVWHCHLLGHEENDMMRPMVMIVPLQITTTNLPAGEVGLAYSQSPVAIGGLSPYTWSVIAGALPGGLTIDPATGIISGTPTTAGTFNFTLQVQDSNAATATQALSITVAPLLQITTTSLPAVGLGVPYSQTVAATGGIASYTWSIAAGALPNGLTINSATGVISGTPTVVGAFPFTVQVQDSIGAIATKALSITVNSSVLAPSVLTATISSGSRVALTWTDNSNNENSFMVERSINGGAFAQIGTVTRTAAQSTATGGTVTYTSTGLTAGNTYAYRVRAFTTTGSTYSAYSNTATVQFTAPSVPTGVTAIAATATATRDQVTLSWTAPASGNQTGYTIQRSANGVSGWSGAGTVGATATTHVQTGLARGRTFYYRIRATNSIGNSAWVISNSVTTP